MKKLMIKPYAIYIEEEGSIYRIMRYNLTKKDWDIMNDVFTNELDAQIKIDELNQEVGLVPFMIE